MSGAPALHKARVAMLILGAATFSACAAEQAAEREVTLEVTHVYVTEPVMGERAALYMTVANNAETDVELVSVSVPFANVTEIHQTIEEGARVRMEPITALTVPAGGEARLVPGGYHIMLLDLIQPFVAGDTLEVTLHFRQADDLQVRAAVLKYVDIEAALETRHEQD